MRRAACERGIALPTVAMMLFIITSITAAVATVSTTGSNEASRDKNAKRALAAADAGIESAMYRLNKTNANSAECATVTTSGLQLESVSSGGWCTEQIEDLGDSARYTYRVSAGSQVTVNRQTLTQRKVVATGVVNGVRRRAMSLAAYVTPQTVFGRHSAVGLNGFYAQNNAVVDGDVTSNSAIRLKNNSQVCGNAIPGPGNQVVLEDNATVCTGYSTTAPTDPIVLNPVDQGNAATVNDNSRIGNLDPWTDQGSSTWNPTTRVLSITGNATLTLTGNVYSFCRLALETNAQLIIGARDPTRPLKIYIDAPENCPSVSGAGSMVQNNATITNANSSPASLELYFVGSSTIDTRVDFQNNSTNTLSMIVYAPRSTVLLQNNATIFGAVAGKTISLENNARIIGDDSLTGVQGKLLNINQRQSWVECTPQPTNSAPDSGC